jgi:hypothetical protein
MNKVVSFKPYGIQPYRAKDYPRGLKCPLCDYVFNIEGEIVYELFVGTKNNSPVVKLVCSKCGQHE